MAKVTRIKPKEEGYIRIELDFTHTEFIQAHFFKPSALALPQEDSPKDIAFVVVAGEKTAIGKYGIELPILDECDDKIVTIYQFDENVSEEQLLAQAVNLQENLKNIESQVKIAMEELNKAKETIKEV